MLRGVVGWCEWRLFGSHPKDTMYLCEVSPCDWYTKRYRCSFLIFEHLLSNMHYFCVYLFSFFFFGIFLHVFFFFLIYLSPNLLVLKCSIFIVTFLCRNIKIRLQFHSSKSIFNDSLVIWVNIIIMHISRFRHKYSIYYVCSR